jgi:hypothetical protein
MVFSLTAILLFSGLWQQVLSPEKAVNITLTEWKIDMPNSLPAGAYNFKITNKGEHSHTLKIKTKNFEVKLPNDLKSGQTAELKVDLKPGVYRVNCPIGFGPFDHGHKGMELELTVTAANAEPNPANTVPAR